MKILIVEDDAGISDFVIPELEHEGYTTCLAVTGRDALVKFEEEKPDLILLDIMLPFKSGDQVLKTVRENSQVPVIIISAKDMVQTKIDVMRMGADDYIIKPFE